MSKGKAAAIFVSLALLAGLFFGFRIIDRAEPSYQGKSLNALFDDYNNASQMNAALKAMGTNAAPFIIRRLRDSDSPWQTKYRSFFPRFPAWLAKFVPKPKAKFGFYQGAVAFQATGADVELILVKSLQDQSPSVRGAAACALGFLRLQNGTDIRNAIPNLIESSRDKDFYVRISSIVAFGYIGPDAYSAVPTLTWLLTEPEMMPGTDWYSVRAAAARALGEIGSKANTAVPTLGTLMTNNNPALRIVSAIAIWRINDMTNSLPVLIQAIGEIKDPSLKREGFEGLGDIGIRAKGAVPLLLNELANHTSSTEFNRPVIIKALKQIDPDAAAKAGVK